MPSFVMQPTFVVRVPRELEDALARLRFAIQSPELVGQATSAGKCFDFRIEEQQRRIWSPHLSIQLSRADNDTEIFARFSPRPEIWTAVMMVYFAASFAIFVSLVFGWVQWSLDKSPWALLATPIAAAMIIVLHVISLVGQRLSNDQMELLRSRFDRAMELAFGKETEVA